MVFEIICKAMGLVSSSLNIWDKFHTYCLRKENDPSGSHTNDGSRDESKDS